MLSLTKNNRLDNLISPFFDDFSFGLNAESYYWKKEDGVYYAIFHIPGFSKDNVDVTVAEGAISVKGVVEMQKPYQKLTVDKFITIPSYGDVDTVEATVKNGILVISMQDKKEKSSKKITIK